MLAGLLLTAGCQPRGPEAFRRGDLLLQSGRPAEAIPLLERAATDLPSEARVWNHLGLAYHGAGREAEAEKAYLRALERNRNYFDVWFNLGALKYGQGDWPETERSLRTYLGIEGNRTNAAAWRLLGLAQFETRQLDSAERSLGTAAQLAPRDPEVWNGLGLIHVARRRFADARKAFTYVIELAPAHAPARRNLAVLTHQHLGDPAGALTQYRAYLALQPAPPDHAQVQALVTALERQLAPPPAVTNRPPVMAVVTNLPPTNALARASSNPPPGRASPPPVVVAPRPEPKKPEPLATVRTSAPPAVVRSNPPVVVKPPAPAPRKPEPEPEVVRVTETPVFVPARDEAVAPPVVRPPVAAASPVVITPPAEAANDPDPVAVAGGTAAADEPPPAIIYPPEDDRPGFWSRANPANWNWRRANPVSWFGKDDPVEQPKPPTPLARSSPGGSLDASGILSQPETRVPARTIAPTPPPKPVIRRYVSQLPAALPPGNRTGAQNTFNSAVAAQERGEAATALSLYEQAAQLDPAYFAAHHNLAVLALLRNDLDRALRAAELASALQPESPAAHQLFASALQRAGYPADAAASLEKLVTLKPDDAAAQLALAGLYARDLAEPAEARPHYQRFLELRPDHPQAGAIRAWLADNP